MKATHRASQHRLLAAVGREYAAAFEPPGSAESIPVIVDARTSGFTLIELVVVLLVVAVLAAVFYPRSAHQPIDLGAQAQQLAGDIRYVQSLAMTQGQRYRINLTATTYFFTLADAGGTPVAHPATLSTAPIGLAASITMSWSNLPSNLLAFDGKGIPYTDNLATTPLAADAVITLSLGATRTVRVSPETGRALVQ